MTTLKFNDAPCQQTDPEVFFPDPSDLDGIYQAKLICAECPLINKCLDYALDNSINKYGIFGGMTPPERERELRRRQNARYKELLRQRRKEIA